MKKSFFILLLFIIALQYGNAQPARLSFDHLTIKEGLPDNGITDIVQDKQGYIWLTTTRGIARYDGYRVKVYQPGMQDKANYLSFYFTQTFLDKNGDLWASSLHLGLFKYDRAADRFIQYKNKSLQIRWAQWGTKIDSTGKVWSNIFTSDYATLQQFDPATGRFKMYGYDQKGAHHINSKFIAPYTDHQGTVWIGSTNGFYLYNPSSDSLTGYFTSNDSLKRKDMFILLQATSTPDKLWLLVRDPHIHLVLMDMKSGKTEDYRHDAVNNTGLGNDTLFTAFEDGKHRLWFGTAAGLSLYDEKSKKFTNYQPVDTVKAPGKNNIKQLTGDKAGNLWMATAYGLLRFNPETGVFKRYFHDKTDPASINGNDIGTLFFDREGTLWIGFNSPVGVDRVNTVKSAFVSIKGKGYKFPWSDIQNVKQAPDGQLWVAARNGLYKYDTLKLTTKLIAREPVYQLFVAKNGLVYYHTADKEGNLGTGGGLLVYDPKTGKTEQYKPIAKDKTSLNSTAITYMMEDHTGIIWIGTDNAGICAFDPQTKKFRRYTYITNDAARTSHNMLNDEHVTVIYEDRAGTLWVVTPYGVLNHFDRKRHIFISSYKPQEGFSNITFINQDNKGRLWVGTEFNGLFLVDSHTGAPIKKFTEKDGLLSDQVLFIHTDQSDQMWLTSERGFTSINTSDLSIKNIKAGGNSWESIFNEGTLGFWHIDGNILCWGGDNMVLFDPKAITKDINQPLVHIENIAYSNPRAAKESSVTIETYRKTEKELSWDQNKVTFNYVALHYTDAAENRYAYQLEGYDNHWMQAGTQRSVTYTNLLPGTYTFRVKAANSDGIWNNKSDSFIVVIHSPWWQTWWAWTGYIVLFAAAGYAFIAYRSRKLVKEKQALEQKVTVRTKQLSEANKELNEKQEEIISQRDQLSDTLTDLKATQTQLIQSEKMASLGELTAGIAHEIQNPLNFVNNFSDVSIELVDEMEAELNKGDKNEALAIASDIRQNLEKINHHGKRADSIVKGMLQHSKSSSGIKEPTDINPLADEYMRLAYHGLRAKDKTFNAAMVSNMSSDLPKVKAVPQDMGRVMLNLFNNAFYAVHQKQKTAGPDYKAEVTLTTSIEDGKVKITVRDNGMGIPDAIKEKIMQPFFTTKPTGEGTGLGLSLTYDMVVKGHGGSIDVNTKEGEYTEFIVSLPA